MTANRVITIAHRGASGYLPEHTLASKAMAHAMGADYIEQDVVLTQDNVPVVLHDIRLESVTNVVDIFPTRAREDGSYYVVDFLLDEIKQLKVQERTDPETNRAVFGGRFPIAQSSFHVPTLAEEIELIQGLNRSTGKTVGIYPEIKSPAWYHDQGYDVSRAVLSVLDYFGYRSSDDPIYVQCFDAVETRRLRTELKTELRLIQLIGENKWKESDTDYDALRTTEGMADLAKFVQGIGPRWDHVIPETDLRGAPVVTPLVHCAHAYGLEVHPYTFRIDSLPEFATSFEKLLGMFIHAANVDGLFTDFPDRVVSFLGEIN